MTEPLTTLCADDIHLWQARFSRLTAHRGDFEALLTPDETTRASRFRFEDARERFIAGRGLLRTLLARYLDRAPRMVRFIYGRRGKPAVPDSPLRFNLSHAGDLLLLGLAWGREIGVDVERIRPMPEMHTVARSHFSALEQAVFFGLPPSRQPYAFYTCWTRKEAYIKATGDGFKLPLKDFDVSFIPEQPPALLRAENDDPARWTMHHIDPEPGYVASVCAEGPPPRLTLLSFTR